jgi:hypothetical protein
MPCCFRNKKGEAAKYHAMWALVVTPSHLDHGGEVGIVGRLVSVQFCYCMISIHIQLHYKMYRMFKACKACLHVQKNELGQPPTSTKLNENLLKKKGLPKPQQHARTSPSLNMVRIMHP